MQTHSQLRYKPVDGTLGWTRTSNPLLTLLVGMAGIESATSAPQTPSASITPHPDRHSNVLLRGSLHKVSHTWQSQQGFVLSRGRAALRYRDRSPFRLGFGDGIEA